MQSFEYVACAQYAIQSEPHKVGWVMRKDVRYRPEKRIGNTRRRYIAFEVRNSNNDMKYVPVKNVNKILGWCCNEIF